jgi:hypothetical protein
LSVNPIRMIQTIAADRDTELTDPPRVIGVRTSADLSPLVERGYYNFVRIHQTLRTTPAMAAGVTKRLWEIGISWSA